MYQEWTSNVYERNGNMLPADKLPEGGFSSVYKFLEQDALAIRASKRSKDFKKYNVYSDMLFVDLDNGFENYYDCCDVLRANSISYSAYESGKKGVHFHVDINPVFGGSIPWFQSCLIKEIFPFLTNPDLTIYRHSSLFALPGRIHPETRKPKTLIASFEGESVLNVPIVAKPLIAFQDMNTDIDALEVGLLQALNLLRSPPSPGTGRQIKLWSMGTQFCEGGLSYETTLEILMKIGQEIGKEDRDIERACKEAFRR